MGAVGASRARPSKFAHPRKPRRYGARPANTPRTLLARCAACATRLGETADAQRPTTMEKEMNTPEIHKAAEPRRITPGRDQPFGASCAPTSTGRDRMLTQPTVPYTPSMASYSAPLPTAQRCTRQLLGWTRTNAPSYTGRPVTPLGAMQIPTETSPFRQSNGCLINSRKDGAS